MPGGGVGQLAVAGAQFWVEEESPQHLNFAPPTIGGGSVRMMLIVADPDAVYQTAIACGAKQVTAISEMHGWRVGRLVDPFGHHWEIGKPLD